MPEAVSGSNVEGGTTLGYGVLRDKNLEYPPELKNVFKSYDV